MSGVRYSKRLNTLLNMVVFEYERIVEEKIETDDPEEFALFTVWSMLAISKARNRVSLEKSLSDNPDNTNQNNPKKQFANGETGGSES